MCDLLWLCMVLYGIFMVLYGISIISNDLFIVLHAQTSDLYTVYTHLGTFQKQHKNQNIFLSPNILQLFFHNGIGFTQKPYHKVILDLQEVKCPSNWEPNHFYTKQLLSIYVTDHWTVAWQFYGLFLAKHRTDWTYILLFRGAAIDPNSFGLVSSSIQLFLSKPTKYSRHHKNTNLLNEFLTAHNSCTTKKYFWKNSYES